MRRRTSRQLPAGAGAGSTGGEAASQRGHAPKVTITGSQKAAQRRESWRCFRRRTISGGLGQPSRDGDRQLAAAVRNVSRSGSGSVGVSWAAENGWMSCEARASAHVKVDSEVVFNAGRRCFLC